MSKKPNLATALHEASGKKLAVIDSVDSSVPLSQSHVKKAPSRAGKKSVTGHFDPEAVRQLKQLALDHDRSLQALLTEALNDVFEKYGKKPIA